MGFTPDGEPPRWYDAGGILIEKISSSRRRVCKTTISRWRKVPAAVAAIRILLLLLLLLAIFDVRMEKSLLTRTTILVNTRVRTTENHNSTSLLQLNKIRDNKKDSRVGHPDNPLTIIIQLKGELGNQLGSLAYGYGLKWILEQDYNVTSSVMLRHQTTSSKWLGARKSITECFPNFRSADFSAGNTKEFERLSREQESLWLGRKHSVYDTNISKRLDALVRILSDDKEMPTNSTDAHISLPFIYANSMANYGYIINRYYDEIRNLFRYDYANPKCCSSVEQPDSQETVLHIRGFKKELGKNVGILGFEELSINKTLNELLVNQSGKLAIIGRFPEQTNEFVEALRHNRRFFATRRVETEFGEQAFCFLLRSSSLIGCSMSTFVKWAANLGNATTARIYSLNSPGRIARFGKNNIFTRYDYTNPTLRKRFSWELYNSEEQDEIERKHS